MKDYTEQKFNKLTAISFEKRENKRTYWNFLCDCGKKIMLSIRSVIIGDNTSCGCFRNKNHIKDQTGEKFNKLTAISFDRRDEDGTSYWKYLCDCGNETITRSSAVAIGDIKSCGCIHNWSTKDFNDRLTELYGNISIKEYTLYDSKVQAYCGNFDDIGIIHGEFDNIPHNLLTHRGCPKCFSESNTKNNLKYTHNKEFFSIPNVLNSYWAGLIAADGYVMKQSLGISLKEEDKYHLEKLIKDINFTGKLRKRITTESKIAKGGFINNLLLINDGKRIIHDLKNNFNITNNKTFTLMPPTNLPEELQHAFIKGFIDGDGWIGSYKNSKLEMGVCGTYEMMLWIKSHFDKIAPSSRKNPANPIKQKSIFRYKISENRAIKVYNFLKNIDTPELQRKWSYNLT